MPELHENILRDMQNLVQGLNEQAEASRMIDPLVEIHFTCESNTPAPEHLEATLRIDRNSGGSCFSDHAIEDEIKMVLHGDALQSLTFIREGVEEKQAPAGSQVDTARWEALAAEIKAFCREILPKPPKGDFSIP